MQARPYVLLTRPSADAAELLAQLLAAVELAVAEQVISLSDGGSCRYRRAGFAAVAHDALVQHHAFWCPRCRILAARAMGLALAPQVDQLQRLFLMDGG